MGTFGYFPGTTSIRSKNILPVDWQCIVLSIILSVFKLAYAKILHWCYIIWLPSVTLSKIRSATNISRDRSCWK